ncbi:hypothetical protein CC78DRAFT_541468 [Lojkania enalia]|uniref:Uncharacterized protein n=1 Tax=Lojkania enalia TaxID=147567 RepID=A0A9P4KFN1_9PLEO|nr:hypothetical protein CC78DRAFT_541468 [Didymosphaeria enalia]
MPSLDAVLEDTPLKSEVAIRSVELRRRPSISLLRAKLIIACQSVVRDGVKEEVMAEKERIKGTVWIVEGARFKTKAFVLDGVTWEMTRVGMEFEAKAMTGDNPGIDAGNGVWIYLNDKIDRQFKEAVPKFMKAVGRKLKDDLQSINNSKRFTKEEKERLQGLKKTLGLHPKTPDGSALYLHLCKAVMQIKTGAA